MLGRAERALQTTSPLDQMPPPCPETPERRSQAQSVLALVRGLEPVQGGSKVGVLGLEPVEPLGVAPRPGEVRLRLLGEREEIVGVATVPPRGFARVLEALE